jgi:hypothetical protein
VNNFLKVLSATAIVAVAASAAAPASAEVRVGVNIGAPVYAQPYAPRAYYGPPRVYHQGYYDSRYDLRARRQAEWRHREWLRHEQLRREEWRREQWRRQHWRGDRHWNGR